MIVKTFFSLLIFSLYIHPAHSFIFSDNKCEKLEWVVEDSRTQGGGWIWFPGKGMGQTLEESYNFAENLALQRLVQECQGIPIEAKFHERCDQKNGDSVESFVRISVRDSDCKLAQMKQSKINNHLQTQLDEYIQLKNLKEINGLNDEEKLHYANSMITENPGLAKNIFKSLCEKSNLTGCYYYYNQLLKEGDYKKVFEGTKDRCLNDDVSFCLIAVKSSMGRESIKSYILKLKNDPLLQKIVTKAKDKHLPGYFYAQLESDLKKKEEIHKNLCESGSALSCSEGAMIAFTQGSDANFSVFSKKLNEIAKDDTSYVAKFMRGRLLDLMGETESSRLNDDKACENVFYSCVIQFLRSNKSIYYEKLKKHVSVIKNEMSPYSEIANDIIESGGRFDEVFKRLGKNKKRYEGYCDQGLWDSCQLLIIHSVYNKIKVHGKYNSDIICTIFPDSYGCYRYKQSIAEDKDLLDIAKVEKEFCIEGRPYQDEACDNKVSLLLGLELMSTKKSNSDFKRSQENYKSYCQNSYSALCIMSFPEHKTKSEVDYFAKCSMDSQYSYYYCMELALSSNGDKKEFALKKLNAIVPNSIVKKEIEENKQAIEQLRKIIASKK